MTLKQTLLTREALKEENIGKPLREIAAKVGYSKTAGNVYNKAIKSHILKALEDKGITKDSLTQSLQALGQLAVNKGELNVAHNSLVSIAKLAGLMKEGTTVTVNQANVLDSIRAVDRAESSVAEPETSYANVPRNENTQES